MAYDLSGEPGYARATIVRRETLDQEGDVDMNAMDLRLKLFP